jgi:hypothetical protein
MTIDNTQDIDLNNEKVEETVETQTEENSEESHEGEEREQSRNESNQESPEDRLARLKRQYEREAKKQGLNTENLKSSKSNKADLDYGEKAFLLASGIKGNDEMNLVKQLRKETGKSLEDLVESRFFKAELEDFRQIRTTTNAVPSNSKRSNQSSIDSVEYWIAKKELPKDPILRRKVVNERYNRERNVNVFGN